MRTPLPSATNPAVMDTDVKEQSEKASSVHSDESLGKPKSWLQRQVARVTYFLTRWGVETNGYPSNFLAATFCSMLTHARPLVLQD